MSDGMSKLMSDFHLVDLTYNVVGHDNFATYHRGTTRIDYALCDTHTATAAIAGGYDPFQYRIKGDHRAITINFHIPTLFGNDNNHLQAPATREFYSTDRKQVCQYLVQRHLYLTTHNFESQLAHLEDSWDLTLAEQLDCDFQKASAQSAANVNANQMWHMWKNSPLLVKRKMSCGESCPSRKLGSIIPHPLPISPEMVAHFLSLPTE